MKTIDSLLKIQAAVTAGLTLYESALPAILSNELQRNYLFEELTKKAFTQEDFFAVNKNGGFDAQYIPIKERTIYPNGKERKIFLSWTAAPYLRIIGDSMLKAPDEEVIRLLLEVVDNYISYVLSQRPANLRSVDESTIGELILKLPLDQVFSNRHYNFIRQRCLDDELLSIANEISERFYQRVMSENNAAVARQTIKLLFDYVIREGGYRSVDAKVPDFYLKEFIAANGQRSFELVGYRLFKLLFDLIEEIDDTDSYSFSSFYISSLAASPADDLEKLSTLLIEFVKIGIHDLSRVGAEDVLSLLRYYGAPIFSRISLYVIGYYYDQELAEKYFWHMSNPIGSYELQRELMFVVDKNRLVFTDQERVRYHQWVDGIKLVEYESESEEAFKDRLLSEQTRWRRFLNSGVSEKYDVTDTIMFQRAETIPDEKYRIVNLDNNQLIEILSNPKLLELYDQSSLLSDIRQFDSERRWALMGLEDACKFLPEVLWSLMISYEPRENEDWDPFFSLTERLIADNTLWHPKETDKSGRAVKNNYNASLWRAIADMFRLAANKRDKAYFDEVYCRKAANLLMAIADKYPGTFKATNYGHEYNDAINSVRGNVYQTLVDIAVAISVQAGVKEIAEPIQRYFDRILSGDTPPDEILWVIGASLPKIGYMNINWIDQKKHELFERTNTEDLKVLKGYLLYANTVYNDLYSILHPYYQLAVGQFVEESNYTSKLLQHICVAYSMKWVHSERLMDTVLEQCNSIQLEEVIKHFGRRTKKTKQSSSVDLDAMRILWGKLIRSLSFKDAERKGALAYALAKWMIHFSEMGEAELQLIFRTTELVGSFPFDYHAMEYLKELASVQPNAVGSILEKGLLESKGFDIVAFESTRIITRRLYEKGEVQLADSIVEKMVDRGYFLLVDIYGEYHKKQP